MSKQTAVEWLYEQLTSTWYDKDSALPLFERAKQLEREQIAKAWNRRTIYLTGNDYYEATYGGKNE